jgi:DNA-binding CsgD family transcriptional regulator
LLELFAHRAQQLDRRWAIASAARCRSLLAAAQGDLDAGLTAAEEAVALWQQLEMPVELGRALLVLGQVRRRRGERRAAREALVQALAIFGSRSASLWAERATEELRRIPIRRGAPDDLTPTEEQVAALAAAGRTNREIARALFMSPKTVEANLTRIYGKLGIRARAELGVRMLERREAGAPPKK